VSDLTTDEQTRVRTALRFMRARCGGWEQLGRAVGADPSTLRQVRSGRANVSASLTIRLARLAKVSLDDLLEGRFPPPNTCPHCGQSITTASAP
jgi:transcriptional regulator with XRE-family HTH domain